MVFFCQQTLTSIDMSNNELVIDILDGEKKMKQKSK